MTAFPSWPKTPRLDKPVAITEKIDGTNGLISIEYFPGRNNKPEQPTIAVVPMIDDEAVEGEWHIRAGSRNRWLTPESDNYGFAKWVQVNATELAKLGPGNHYGEWFGSGIQRGYGLTNGDKRFALFNVARWKELASGDPWGPKGDEEYPYATAVQVPAVPGLTVVPLISVIPGYDMSVWAEMSLALLEQHGSLAVPGFSRPEGIILFHEGARASFKAFTEFNSK